MDDLTILDGWRLLRRIPSQKGVFIVWDSNLNLWRVSSQAFKGHKSDPRRFSVYIEPVLHEHGLDASSVLLDAARYAVVSVTAADARSVQQEIERAPQPSDPAHGHVVGEKTKPVTNRLAELAQWVLPPQSWPWPAPAPE